MGNRKKIKQFIVNWMLVLGMLVGAGSYLLYDSLTFLHPAGPVLLRCCEIIQPVLLFSMLFLTFCQVDPERIRPQKWMWQALLLQAGIYVAIASVLIWGLHGSGRIADFILEYKLPLETVLLCVICPTATACAVVTGKLGGDMAAVVTYTILINFIVAILVPLFVPAIYPQEGLSFAVAFTKILSKVFPLLILPCLAAWFVRLFPDLHRFFVHYAHWSFYIWSVSLMLAILMSTRAIIKSDKGSEVLIGIAIATVISCAVQFWAGKKIGSRYGSGITAGQAVGQKNTVFAIWMGYTFLDPVISVAGGFYSIAHNVFNTWQLYRKRKLDA